jgi:hypothetical protein
MIRGIGYRTAATIFVFTGLWFILGLLMLASPVPHALGIGGAMFVAWLLLFLAMLALAGASLTMAAINGLFPPSEPRATRVVSPPPPVVAGRDPRASAATATHDADGRPLPWTQSPLPERAPRRPGTRSRPADRRQGP